MSLDPTTMNTENLLKLAALLEDDAANFTGMKFDIGTIAEISEDVEAAVWSPALDCGTTGCGMGLAAISGEFSRLGYEIARGDFCILLDGERALYDDAAEELFDLDTYTAHQLFSPDYYSQNVKKGREGELELAARIRKLVAQGHLDEISSASRRLPPCPVMLNDER